MVIIALVSLFIVGTVVDYDVHGIIPPNQLAQSTLPHGVKAAEHH